MNNNVILKIVCFILVLTCVNLIVVAQTTSIGDEATTETIDSKNPFEKWFNASYLTGDWKGLRNKLQDKGIDLEVSYYSQGWMKTHGGLNNHTRTNYIGLIDMALTVDTEKLGLWNGGELFILGQSIHGHTLTEKEVGDYQNYSYLEASQRTQLSEFWYKQSYFSDKLIFKIGKQDANIDFCYLEKGFEYINSSFFVPTNIPMPFYPEPKLGVAAFFKPQNNLTIKAGFYDGSTSEQRSVFKTAFDGKEGGFFIVEPDISHSYKGYKGKFALGYWFHNGDVEELTTNPNPRMIKTQYGVYTVFEQMIFKENRKDMEDHQGLTLLGQFSWGPSDRTEASTYYGAGLSYKGLIPHRNEDTAAIGMAMANFSGRLKTSEAKTAETALEIFYKAQLTPWLAIQPDLQYIFRPDGNLKSALVIGVQTIIDF